MKYHLHTPDLHIHPFLYPYHNDMYTVQPTYLIQNILTLLLFPRPAVM